MPNRIIKESLCSSEKISSLSDFDFRLWISLILLADDNGCGDARPAIIKGRAFPLRDRVTAKDLEGSLSRLAAGSCVTLYTVDGRPYYQFPGWSHHQRIRQVKGKYPLPDAADCNDLQKSAANCGELPQTATSCGLNPIRIQSESEYKSESECARDARSGF